MKLERYRYVVWFRSKLSIITVKLRFSNQKFKRNLIWFSNRNWVLDQWWYCRLIDRMKTCWKPGRIEVFLVCILFTRYPYRNFNENYAFSVSGRVRWVNPQIFHIILLFVWFLWVRSDLSATNLMHFEIFMNNQLIWWSKK